MKNRIVVSFEGEYIQVISEGKKDYQFTLNLWTQIVECCQLNSCYKVLGIANTSRPVSTEAAYHQKDLFAQLGIDANYKIAWVELDKKSFNTTYFAENVLKSSGYNVRLYKSVAEAVLWLTQQENSK